MRCEQAPSRTGTLTAIVNIPMCPHCGYDFEASKPIQRGRWFLFPDKTIFDGQRLNVTGQQAGALYTIAAGCGEVVTREAILNRISDTENLNLVSVILSRLKDKLGWRYPVETVHGRGVRWAA